tara:strand:- start:12 stop:353 length:342 start_codon:yes stop_codon:yes gene_type:complete
MAHHMMKYRLASDGTIPTFLCLHSEGVGGMFVVADPSTPSPRDMVMVGVSETDDVGDAEVIPTKADLLTYLTTVGANWTQDDPTQPGNPEAKIPFDPSAATDWAWDRLDALNA